jgi:hypothetical protein
LLGLGEVKPNQKNQVNLTQDLLGLGEEMVKIDANRVERKNKKTLDRPVGGVSYLTAGTPLPCGSDPPPRGANRVEARHRVAGVRDLRKGATTGPLDGGTLTVGVDARAGEGAGSSAAILHRATMGGVALWTLRFLLSKGIWWMNRDKE